MAIAHEWLRAQVGKRAVDFVTRDWAGLYVDQLMRIAAIESDHALFSMHSDSVAVAVLLGRSDDRSHRNVLEFADPLKSVTNLPPFDRKLMFVAHVLVSASAASAEIRALRFDTIRGGLLDLDEFRFGKLLFLAHDLGRDELALDGVRNK